MRAQLVKYWTATRSSYWFVPSLMAIGAFAVSILTTAADRAVGASLAETLPWASLDTPEGARALLSAIATSMITVAGVTFSMTIAAVAFAASNLGPRLLSNFMRDVSNQVTLGTFIATFVYCLLILRTIHGGSGESGEGIAKFVPHLGILLALLLTLASLGVLIYFIHHVPRTIAASAVVAELGHELLRMVAEIFPSSLGKEPPDGILLPDEASDYRIEDGEAVRSRSNGYIMHFEPATIMELTEGHGLVVRFIRRPGDFVSEGEIVGYAFGKRAADDELRDRVMDAIVVNRERTPQQDVLFVVQQLVEIAIRALSPAVNDPFTAISCQRWLGSALISVGRRHTPSPYRYDAAGRLRVIVPGLEFHDIAAAVFDNLRQYVSTDRNAVLGMLGMIESVLINVSYQPYREILLEHAAAVAAGAEAGLAEARDLQLVAIRYAELRTAASLKAYVGEIHEIS